MLSDKKFEKIMRKRAREINSLFNLELPFHREIFDFHSLIAKQAIEEVGAREIEWFTDVMPGFKFEGEAGQTAAMAFESGYGARDVDPDDNMSLPNLMLRMADIYSHYKPTEQTEFANWVRLSEGLMLGLLHTDLKRTAGSDIYMPIPSFVIEIPDETIYIKDNITGWHETKYIVVTEGESPYFGRGLFIYAWSQANENSEHVLEDHAEYFPLDISDPTESLDNVIQVYEELRQEAMSGITGYSHKSSIGKRERSVEWKDITGRIFGEVYSGVGFRERLLRIVINTILYINSESAVVESVHQGEINRLKRSIRQKKKKKASPQAKKKLKQLEQDPYYILGTDITITPRQLQEFEEAAEEDARAKKSGRKLTKPTLTRGHWKRQVHGKGRSLRKLIWIKPYVRGKELGGPIVTHRYRFRENPEPMIVPYWWPDDDTYEYVEDDNLY